MSVRRGDCSVASAQLPRLDRLGIDDNDDFDDIDDFDDNDDNDGFRPDFRGWITAIVDGSTVDARAWR
ncbi:hypothetical protein [Brevibacterium sp. ZH18]|uniref:hypothetical protein n=1 Tax=Brevibacterium sp. ZH18 TaxID=2927784 RepID=UPI001F616623|nr:hypothetical protein [Brevibacterium sp. ZH18]MCI4010561.1 hypothetical protein [Brevibacterium sp. ZH18]